jgi:hypothetical protein
MHVWSVLPVVSFVFEIPVEEGRNLIDGLLDSPKIVPLLVWVLIKSLVFCTRLHPPSY